MRTILLDRPDVIRHLDALSLMERLRQGFVLGSRHAAASSPEGLLRHPGSPADLPAYARLEVGLLPGGDGSAAERLWLHDADSDRLLAVIDTGHLAAVTSAVSCAIAADVLGRQDAVRVAVLGAGAHAGAQLKSLRLVRSLEHVRVFDPELERMASFARRMYQALALPVRMAGSVEEAVADADLVIAVTNATEPLLFPGMVGPGCHLTSVGADVPGHCELSATLIRQSSFFCDNRDRALAAEALPAMQLGPEVIAAELGEVISGARPGRSDRDEITLYAAFGLPHQLLIAAWLVYLGAREDEDIARMELDPSGRPLV